MNADTMIAWMAFQRRHELREDGEPGAKTLAAVELVEERLHICHGKGPVFVEDEYVPVKHFDGYPWARKKKLKANGTAIYRNPTELIPAFAIKVDTLFRIMKGEYGLDPVLQEAFRTFERAEALNEKGTGIKKSMHCYGAAVDIIHRTKAWGAEHAFWEFMRETAEELGMFVLYYGNGSMRDKAHIQAIPVSEQKMFRAMNDEERAKHVATRT